MAQDMRYYLGIDLNDRMAMISYYQDNMKEPETVSTTLGSEYYQIPLAMAMRPDQKTWAFGDDARRLAKNNEAVCADSLLSRALKGDSLKFGHQSFTAEELLTLFLRRLMDLPRMLNQTAVCERVVICLERITPQNMELIYRIIQALGIPEEKFLLIDHKASFYYFALSQQEILWVHDVLLFEAGRGAIRYLDLRRNTRIRPQIVTVTESRRYSLSAVDTDNEFLRLLKEILENRTVSTVYLVGEGFDGSWMKNSLSFLCRGRRTFLGKNLFSKGACYAAVLAGQYDYWPFAYIGENEMKFNLSIKVRNEDREVSYNLISAGRSWFHCRKVCEVLIQGSAAIDLYKQLPDSRDPVVETMELEDLPEETGRVTRLRITAVPMSDTKINLEITDLGFGELFRSSGKTWHYMVSM